MFESLPPSSVEMRNPFIVLRLVLFAILVYVNVLILGFAGWNLSVLKSLEDPALGAPTFVIVNACFLICLLVGCFVSLWLPKSHLETVRYECAWTAVMSTLTLASSFDVTVNGSPALCQGISVTACASSTLVVALSWISCMILLLYSFALLTTAVTHMIIIPDVWMTSVRAVPWFVAPSNHIEAARVPSLPEKALPPHREDVVDIKRLSFHYRTPIFEQHAKTIPTSPRTPPPHEQPQTILAPPRFPTMPASPVWEPRSEAPLPAEPTSPVTPASPEIPSPPPSDPFPMERRTTWTSRVAALTTKRSCESLRPAWAKRTTEGRRGVDQPFAHPRPAPPPASFPRFSFSLKPGTVLPPVRPLRPLKLKSAWSQSTTSATSPPPVPALPPKAHMHSNRELGGAAKPGMLDSPTSTFYIDLERDSVVPVPAGLAESAARPISYEMFPQDVIDPDQPITRSVRSQWVRADSDASSTQSVR